MDSGTHPQLAGDWQVESIAGEAVDPEAPREVRFEAGTISGRVGVNRFTGPYTIEGDLLHIRHVATTRMFGPPELMDLERRFTSHLSGDHEIAIGDDGLVLGHGDTAICLSRKPGLTVEGSVFYRERIRLPPGSVVAVELIDITADLGAEPLGSQVIAGALSPPFRFSVSAGAAPHETGRMALQARIVSDQGEVLWATDSPVIVAEDGEPVEVMVRRGGFDGAV